MILPYFPPTRPGLKRQSLVQTVSSSGARIQPRSLSRRRLLTIRQENYQMSDNPLLATIIIIIIRLKIGFSAPASARPAKQPGAQCRSAQVSSNPQFHLSLRICNPTFHASKKCLARNLVEDHFLSHQSLLVILYLQEQQVWEWRVTTQGAT